MTCLKQFQLQRYLENSDMDPLRETIEEHLRCCARCGAAFDRAVAIHRRADGWLSALSSPADEEEIDISKGWAGVTSRVAATNDHLGRLLAPTVEIPWFVSLFQNLRELIQPTMLPALEVSSRPIAVKDIWGLYNINPRSRFVALGIHVVGFSLLMFGFSSPQVQKVLSEKFVILDPNLKPYVQPVTPDQGGGGGGARELEPVSKGRAPRPAPRQFTPPQIVQQPPRLAVLPTIVAPPDTLLPQNNLPNWGDPLAKLASLSNGSGFGGGMGDGRDGGLGPGDGSGFRRGNSGGVAGSVFEPGGAVSAPVAILKVDPEYSEDARKAKYSGSVLLSIVVDVEGKVRDIRVVRSLGMGLDERAVEAVAKWKFKPGRRGGEPVNVRATVEVTFRLL